jgi:hypothetical protein
MRLVFASAATLGLMAAAAAFATFHTAAPAHTSQAAAPKDAVPGLIWRSGTATMRLTDRPCPVDNFTRVLEIEGLAPARAYVVQQGRHQFTGCWAKDMDGDVITMEGNREEPGSIPLSWFQAASTPAKPAG